MAELQQRMRSAGLFDRERFARLADWLAVALAASLPWSTSATGVLTALWLVAVVLTLNVADLRRGLSTPAGGLPAALCAIALIGMIWATDATAAERWDGVISFFKLLFVPLFIIHFGRSERGAWVLVAYLASCTVLLVFSWALVLVPAVAELWPARPLLGVPVKDYIAQSAEFTVCVFVLAKLALDETRARRYRHATAQLLLAALFAMNILYVSASRTVLVIIPILLLVFALKHLSRKATIAVLPAAVLAVALAWPNSMILKFHLDPLLGELRDFQPEAPGTRAGLRIEYWRKSIEFVAAAPILGHGTGSIREQFRKAAVGQTGAAADASTNPHNQTFVVAIQLGLLGTAVLFAMWLAHLMVFRGEGLLAWTGSVVVIQNIVGSLFNSHLSDFAHGWGYVIGVGVAAGMVLKNADAIKRV